MRHQLLGLAVLLLLGGPGCIDDETLGADRRAVVSPQGVRLQGVRLQGVRLQGVRLQGVRLQGVRLQGVRLQGVRLQGSELAAIDGDRELRGRDLVGATLEAALDDGSTLELTIASAEWRTGHDDLLELVVTALDETRTPYNVCGDDGRAIFLQGTWDETGAWHRDDELITLACSTGVLFKCTDWNYKPWLGLRALHQSCTRAARADYCGNGEPGTQDGTLIDIYDTYGINEPVDLRLFDLGGDATAPESKDDDPKVIDEADLAALQHEAIFGEDGATKGIARTRYDGYQPSCSLPVYDDEVMGDVWQRLVADGEPAVAIRSLPKELYGQLKDDF